MPLTHHPSRPLSSMTSETVAALNVGLLPGLDVLTPLEHTERVLFCQLRRLQLSACLMLLLLLGLFAVGTVLQHCSFCLFVKLGFNFGLVLQGLLIKILVFLRKGGLTLCAASRFARKSSISAEKVACVHSSTCSGSTRSNCMISSASFADGLINGDLVVFCNTSCNVSNWLEFCEHLQRRLNPQ